MTTPNFQASTHPAPKRSIAPRIALIVAAVLLVGALALAVPTYLGLVAKRDALTKAKEGAATASSEAKTAREAVTKFEKEHPGIAEWPDLKKKATERCKEFSESTLPRNETAARLFDMTLTTSPLVDDPVEAHVCPQKYWTMAKGHAVLSSSNTTFTNFKCVNNGGGVVTISGSFTAKIPTEIVKAGLSKGTFKLTATAATASDAPLVTKEITYKANPDQPVAWSATLTNVPNTARRCAVKLASWWPDGLK